MAKAVDRSRKNIAEFLSDLLLHEGNIKGNLLFPNP